MSIRNVYMASLIYSILIVSGIGLVSWLVKVDIWMYVFLLATLMLILAREYANVTYTLLIFLQVSHKNLGRKVIYEIKSKADATSGYFTWVAIGIMVLSVLLHVKNNLPMSSPFNGGVVAAFVGFSIFLEIYSIRFTKLAIVTLLR